MVASTGWTRAHAIRTSRSGPRSVALLAIATGGVLVGTALFLAAALLPRHAEAEDGVPYPGDEAAVEDRDRDGLADLYEFHLGTDPECADSDSDGISDGLEVAHRSNPLIPSTPLPDESAVRLDFIPEAGGIRVAVTVHSRTGFDRQTTLDMIIATGETHRSCTQEFLAVGRRFRASGGRVVGYLSDRLPLAEMARRFSLGVLLDNGSDFVIDDALVGVRGGQFFRTEMTVRPDGTLIGGTLFLTVTVETEGQPGFSPNEDCKQVFGRVNGPVKVILEEFCEDAVDRYCPENCGSDVGLRVVCIREIFRR